MTTISIKMPEAMLREITQEAQSRRVGKSEFIRDCLDRALRRGKKTKKSASCLDLMGESVGSFRGPRDLSTNRRHLIEAV
ncbi:MAG TPA: ribbon-helix-helix domain-containing protein, partial [Candidatus Acidoferrales bacterium]|nr:ribbon-helix-helix domain-containing protein [Candidatus Acidoferrales bacterium]